MSDTEKDKPVDDDILECKSDVLRARDIIPGGTGGKKSNERPESHEAEKDTEKAGAESAGSKTEGDVPRFDLAEQIMAEQRKIASVRRQGPGRKGEANPPAIKDAPPADMRSPATVKQPPGATGDERRIGAEHPEKAAELDRVISEIVARDIERLCRGVRKS